MLGAERTRRGGGCRAWALTLALGAASTSASGAPPPALIVVTPDDGCPAATAVAAALGPLLPSVRVSARDGAAGALVVRVEDRDDRYGVIVAGAVREVREPARDCAERARVASVIIALTVDPPAVSPAPAPAARPPPETSVAARAAAAAPTQWHVLLQADVALESAPDVDAVNGVTGGGAVRAWVGRPRLGVGLGIAAVAPLTLRLAAGKVQVARIPCDLDVYGALRGGRWEGAAEVGLALGAIRMVGQDVAAAARAYRLEVGVRTAATARFWAGSKVAPFLGIEALVVPSPHELVVSSVGVVGHTPRLWLGVHVGVVGRLR